MASWPARDQEPCTQYAQKCPVCARFLLGGQNIVAFGDWAVHASCIAAVAPRPERADPAVARSAHDALRREYATTPQDLWDFREPGMCCVCAALAYLNGVRGCAPCFRVFDAKAAHING